MKKILAILTTIGVLIGGWYFVHEENVPVVPDTKYAVGATKTMTAVGNAQIDTAQSKFGGASGLFDGTNSKAYTADNTDWDLGTGKFTIDFWFKKNASTNYQWIVGQAGSASSFWGVAIHPGASDTLIFASITGGAWDVNFSITTTLGTGFHHFEIVRDGTTSGTWHMFVDGTELTKTLAVGSYAGTIYNSTANLEIGANAFGALGTWTDGWIDELRISKGIARHTSGFSVETSEYCADSDTHLLLHMNGTDGSTTFTDDSMTSCSTGTQNNGCHGVFYGQVHCQM